MNVEIDYKELIEDLKVWEDIARGKSMNVIIKEGTPRLASLQRLLGYVRETMQDEGKV